MLMSGGSMAHPTEGSSAVKKSRRFTYADYRTWPNNERWELFEGTAYAMSPAPGRKHQVLLGELFVQLQAWFKGRKCKPHLAPVDVFWTEDKRKPLENENTITQPDLFVVCDPSALLPEGVRGAPDFIIEILSPATAYRDATEKKLLHEKFAVREYWIVNPETLEVLIYTRDEGDSYGLPTTADLREGINVSIFPGLRLHVTPADLF